MFRSVSDWRSYWRCHMFLKNEPVWRDKGGRKSPPGWHPGGLGRTGAGAFHSTQQKAVTVIASFTDGTSSLSTSLCQAGGSTWDKSCFVWGSHCDCPSWKGFWVCGGKEMCYFKKWLMGRLESRICKCPRCSDNGCMLAANVNALGGEHCWCLGCTFRLCASAAAASLKALCGRITGN